MYIKPEPLSSGSNLSSVLRVLIVLLIINKQFWIKVMATTRLSVLFLFCFIGYSTIAAPLVKRQSYNDNSNLTDYFKFANCLLSIQNKQVPEKSFQFADSVLSLSNLTQLDYEESSKVICGEPECTKDCCKLLAYKMTLVVLYNKEINNNTDLVDYVVEEKETNWLDNLDNLKISLNSTYASCTLELPGYTQHSVNEKETVWNDTSYLSNKIEKLHKPDCIC